MNDQINEQQGNEQQVNEQKPGKKGIDSLALRIALIAVAVVFIAGIVKLKMSNQDIKAKTSSMNGSSCFNDFELEDIDGNKVDESIFSDYKITLINCWGTFCSPCIQEMPTLYELSQEYEEKGVQIIGMCTDLTDKQGNVDQDQLKEAHTIVEKTGAVYPHLIPSGDVFNSFSSKIIAVPTTAFVDSQGNIIDQIMGAKEADEWRKIIDEHLASIDDQSK
ncbi:MAG: TlpA family protein disulfide reductase [Clostridia bacterium]|nr:TlpA family protein disulfide reductase [Clostridia bacterium]